MSSLWNTEYATFPRCNMAVRQDGGVVDDRPADEVAARADMGRGDAAEAPGPAAPSHVIIQLLEGDDEAEDADALAVASADAEAARTEAAVKAVGAAAARLEHDLKLDLTEAGAKAAVLAAAGAACTDMVETGVVSRVEKRVRGCLRASTMEGCGALCRELPPDTWLMPSQDGDFQGATQEAYVARGSVRLGAAVRDVGVDALAPLAHPQLCDDVTGPAQQLVCAHCRSDLVRLPYHRLGLQAGRELLAYLSRQRAELFLCHFCDECVVRHVDAMLTAEGASPTEVVADVLRMIKCAPSIK